MNPAVTYVYNTLPIALQNALCTADGYRRHRQRFAFCRRCADGLS